MCEPDVPKLSPYDARWSADFAALAARVRAALGPLASRIEHVGSTAVPGLDALPIIDLDVIVARAEDLSPAFAGLAALGYAHEGDLGIVGREAFRWPPGEPRHHLYLLVEGARELSRHLGFRDALRTNAALRADYAALKRSLAAAHSADRAAYKRGKSEFIEATLRQLGRG